MTRLARIAASLLLLALTATFWMLLLAPGRPFSTPVEIVRPPLAFSPAAPGDLPAVDAPVVARLAFVGDIMQHRAQAGDDFAASYAAVAPILRRADLAIGNLEFPVDPDLPVGPPAHSVRFNGAPAHLDALKAAGFDILATANNHALDQGISGLRATLRQLAERNLTAVGTADKRDALEPVVVETGGARVAFVGYTRLPNIYEGADGEPAWPPRDMPLFELHFHDWSAEFREEGQRLFAEHVRRAREMGADLVVALPHWGHEWHLAPDAHQRLAARDMIDAGFDLVVGGHGHVLNPAELYKGRLIAYSLGTFISDFVEIEARTGAILEVAVAKPPGGPAQLADFRFLPTLVRRDGHRVVPLDDPTDGEAAKARALARAVVDPVTAD